MIFRSAKVMVDGEIAGHISEMESGYRFAYEREYLALGNSQPVSLTLPLRSEPYVSKTFFAFFDGLIPEGWLLALAEKTWKLDARDRMGLLMTCCRECIGNVSIIPEETAQ